MTLWLAMGMGAACAQEPTASRPNGFPADFVDRLAARACELHCRPTPSQAHCREIYRARFSLALRRAPSLDGGATPTVDLKQAEACIQTLTCTALVSEGMPDSKACAQMVDTGTAFVFSSGACLDDWDCFGFGSKCGPGDSYLWEGTWCPNDTTPCVVPATPGCGMCRDSVVLPKQNSPCDGDLCAGGLVCAGNRCLPVVGLGESCTAATCADGLACHSGLGTCFLLGAENCASGTCEVGQRCRVEGDLVARCRPALVVGQACSATATGDECVASAYCSPTSEQCEGRALAGDPCSMGSCDAGLVCVHGACVTAGVEGAPCVRDKECVSGQVCDPSNHVCHPGGCYF